MLYIYIYREEKKTSTVRMFPIGREWWFSDFLSTNIYIYIFLRHVYTVHYILHDTHSLCTCTVLLYSRKLWSLYCTVVSFISIPWVCFFFLFRRCIFAVLCHFFHGPIFLPDVSVLLTVVRTCLGRAVKVLYAADSNLLRWAMQYCSASEVGE